MKEQFVTYDIALKFKELGFDEECFAEIFSDNSICITRPYKNSESSDGVILAPLWQQAINWCLNKLESRNLEPYNRRWKIEYCADSSGAIDFGEGDFYFEFESLKQAVEKALELINKE
jgi:hypothetical protein